MVVKKTRNKECCKDVLNLPEKWRRRSVSKEGWQG